MAQHDYVINNQSGAAFRADLNNALAAIVSQNSGAAEPSVTYAYQPWADTTTGLFKIRNAANSAWITLYQLDGEWSTIALENGTVAAPSLYFKDSGTDTGVYSPGVDQVGIATGGVQRVNFNGATEVVFNDGGADVDFRIEGDTKANLFKVDAGTDAVSVDGAFSVTGDATVGSLNGGPFAGTRNRIINGDMRIDQRYGGAAFTPSSPTSNTYLIDRWFVTQELANSWTLQQNRNSVTPPAGFTSYFGIQVNSSSTPTTSSYNALVQIVEGLNLSDLNWGSASAVPVVLSFWARSSVTGQHGGSVRNGAATFVSYPFSYTISAADTWEYKTIVISGSTTGTFATDNTSGLCLFFDLGCGSANRGTAGSWATQNVFGATGGVNVISTASATFYITGVQLEPGTVATPFERRSYGQELALCQRYYQEFQYQTGGTATSGVGFYGQAFYKVDMRISPTITFSSVGAVGFFDTAVPTIASVNNTREVSFYKTPTGTGGGIYSFVGTLSAEL